MRFDPAHAAGLDLLRVRRSGFDDQSRRGALRRRLRNHAGSSPTDPPRTVAAIDRRTRTPRVVGALAPRVVAGGKTRRRRDRRALRADKAGRFPIPGGARKPETSRRRRELPLERFVVPPAVVRVRRVSNARDARGGLRLVVPAGVSPVVVVVVVAVGRLAVRVRRDGLQLHPVLRHVRRVEAAAVLPQEPRAPRALRGGGSLGRRRRRRGAASGRPPPRSADPP
mmetsp:Transcript_4973/g.22268  ORF Transcript_4973/g.22268 Transcript_4973/m.22268 type:complete len:225 (+) Transcript_4973:333-1007(+)